LVEVGEEASEGILQVDLAIVIVGLQVLEEVNEHVRVSFIDDAISLLKELMKF
jgi:hypothetical protein